MSHPAAHLAGSIRFPGGPPTPRKASVSRMRSQLRGHGIGSAHLNEPFRCAEGTLLWQRGSLRETPRRRPPTATASAYPLSRL